MSIYLLSYSFRIYIVMLAYLKNPKSGYLFFINLQEGDALWKCPMTFTYKLLWS